MITASRMQKQPTPNNAQPNYYIDLTCLHSQKLALQSFDIGSRRTRRFC